MPPLFTAIVVLLLVSPADEPQFNGRPLSGWLTLLKEDPTARKRRAAVVALGQIAAGSKAEFDTAIGAVGRALRTTPARQYGGRRRRSWGSRMSRRQRWRSPI